MSDTELHRGTLTKIDTGNLTAEEYLKSLQFEDTLLEHSNSYLSRIKEYKILNNELYLCDDTKYIGDDYISHIIDNKDGTYSYIAQFYNGATYLDEVLEEELKSNDYH